MPKCIACVCWFSGFIIIGKNCFVALLILILVIGPYTKTVNAAASV